MDKHIKTVDRVKNSSLLNKRVSCLSGIKTSIVGSVLMIFTGTVFFSCDNEDVVQTEPMREMSLVSDHSASTRASDVSLEPGLVDYDIWGRSTDLQPNTSYVITFPAKKENVLYFYVRNLSSTRLKVSHYRDGKQINSWRLKANQHPGERAQEILFPRMSYSSSASVVTVKITNNSSRVAPIEWTANFVSD